MMLLLMLLLPASLVADVVSGMMIDLAFITIRVYKLFIFEFRAGKQAGR